jgi:tripartite-type tricarboxylate transporter receptor subunit TctC
LRAIGITGTKRMASAADIPTIAESGLPGFDLTGWQGLLAPANTPRDIVMQLNTAVHKILATPEIRRVWEEAGLEIVNWTPEQFAARLRDDYDRYGRLIQKIGSGIEQ